MPQKEENKANQNQAQKINATVEIRWKFVAGKGNPRKRIDKQKEMGKLKENNAKNNLWNLRCYRKSWAI